MTRTKQFPIAAAVAGVLAAIGITVKLAGTSSNPLEARADNALAQATESASSTLQNLQTQIDELTEVQNDPGFAKLPAAKQEAVREKLRALKGLKSYKEFEQQLNDIPEPRTARSAGQLKQILERLEKLPIPENLPE